MIHQNNENNEKDEEKCDFIARISFLYWSGGAGHSGNPKDGPAARNASS